MINYGKYVLMKANVIISHNDIVVANERYWREMMMKQYDVVKINW